MSPVWEVRTIAELCSRVTSGGTPSRTRPEYYGGDIVWVKTGELLDSEITNSEEKLTLAGLANSSAKLLPVDTILMAMYGATVGALGRLGTQAACNQACCAMVADASRTDSRWLYYALLNDRARIVGRATGAAQQNLSGATIKSFSYLTPSLPEQRAIADVLGALDEKIAANASLSSTADELSWGEFHTFLRKAELTERATADVATVVLGGTPSRARPEFWTNGTVPWLNSGELNAARVLEPSALITEEALSKSAAKMMPPGATLIAITGATLGKIARLEIAAAGNQSIVGVWGDDPNMSVWLFFALRARRDQLLTRATGAAQQHVSKADVAQLQVPVPSPETLRIFGQRATPLLDLATNAERESATLAATRDALLPRLMSGKLHVRDAEAAVAAAGV